MREPGVTTEFLESFAAAWNRHDADAILEHMAPDAAMQLSAGPDPWGVRSTGHDEIRRAIEQVFADFPDARWNHPQHFVAGDRGVSEWVFSGTGPDGWVELQGCDVFTFSGGKITMKDSYRKRPTG
jgi:ketosteroid isomerase-like protein